MALRIPPGRAGRLWLVHRIDIASRASEILEQKRQALLQEEARRREEHELAEREWTAAAAEARTWLRRAAILGGERNLRLASFYAARPVEIALAWRNTLGVVHPAEARVTWPDSRDAGILTGTSALVEAQRAHRRAVESAARFGVARTSLERIGAELARTSQRLRAIERRWLPEHESALAGLELQLEEYEREDGARIRWALRRGRKRDAHGRRAPAPARRSGRRG
jgi:V/A-type H+-transporting ATPase subunit D